ncbi:MAG: undecaprenyl-diphosphate phosphatase [Deltaproteobacteria bacterium]|nr:MAG: undecaprenyl-diphosphate phosphatase [Deltaproteobacteria bacterium]
MTLIQSILIGLVEGITEFLPISSTGHMILTSHFMGLADEKTATFEVFIQLGAILAVVAAYPKRFLGLLNFHNSDSFSGLNGIKRLILTTLPALGLGALLHHWIKAHLFTPETVVIGLALGGVAIIILEKKLKSFHIDSLDNLPLQTAFFIGCFQCLALWPGVSRAAATILGAMFLGVNRKTATEYSFFAAVPVMCAAVLLDLYKSLPLLQSSDIPIFAVGFLIAFFSAWLAIRSLIKLVSSNTLIGFGWYRIALATLVLLILK